MAAAVLKNPSPWRAWVALAIGVGGVATLALSAVNLARWPVIDMGGVVARAMIATVLVVQLLPLAGLVWGWAFRERRQELWRVLYVLWLVPALGALVLGVIGAAGFFR